MQKKDLATPCLVLDLDLLERNVRVMQTAVSGAGKQLRPHAKTHKCSALARQQIAAGAIGVCAAKVSEAEALVKAGVEGILITGPVATADKMARLVELVVASPSLMVVVDHPAMAVALDAELGRRGVSMSVLIDIDVGLHRTGVTPAGVPALAAALSACRHLRLAGVQAYAGQVQHIPEYPARAEASRQSLRDALAMFDGLRTRTKTCTIFSASGTGTAEIDLDEPGITEMQAGSYVCMDTEYLNIGSAADADGFHTFAPALRLLTTVVSANQRGFVTVDAGLKALYRDGGRPRVLAPADAGLQYDWFGDEYGRIAYPGGGEPPELGSVLELVTSHCDPTVNLFDRFHLTRGSAVVDVWPIDLRGCSQ